MLLNHWMIADCSKARACIQTYKEVVCPIRMKVFCFSFPELCCRVNWYTQKWTIGRMLLQTIFRLADGLEGPHVMTSLGSTMISSSLCSSHDVGFGVHLTPLRGVLIYYVNMHWYQQIPWTISHLWSKYLPQQSINHPSHRGMGFHLPRQHTQDHLHHCRHHLRTHVVPEPGGVDLPFKRLRLFGANFQKKL